MPKDNLPLYFEELKLKEDTTLSLSDLIAQLKQQIPLNYLEIKLEEGNYGGSTNPKWKDKPLSERYFFTYQEREIQLDLPHSLMDKLGLKKGEDITQPLYLDPQVLTRKETYKGITLQAGEIILVNPNKIVMKDQEIQIDLTSAGIKDLENTIAEQTRQIQAKDREITDLRNQLTTANTTITQKNTQINTLQTNYNNANNRANNLQTQLNTANSELQKEKGWWDKWINSEIPLINRQVGAGHSWCKAFFFSPNPTDNVYSPYICDTFFIEAAIPEVQRKLKLAIKEKIYHYYRDK